MPLMINTYWQRAKIGLKQHTKFPLQLSIVWHLKKKSVKGSMHKSNEINERVMRFGHYSV